ncbi:MAG: hypothetical protein HWE16_05800 [Gammaproteobacteria bacterium]|nr:hypothetical protein [Gammaproteobacteria bacterium]
MNHHFNPKIAKEHSVDEAIFLNNLAFWLFTNECNKINFRNGKYWSYNSYKALSDIFYYWTQSKIKRIVDKLKSKKIIATGNFNKAGFDKTLWYTIIDQNIYDTCVGDSKFAIVRKRTIDSTKSDYRKNQSEPSRVRKQTTNTIYKNNIKKPLVREFKQFGFIEPKPFSDCLEQFEKDKTLKGLNNSDFKQYAQDWLIKFP